MSLEQENGSEKEPSQNTLGDPSVNEVVVIIKTMWPVKNDNDMMEYDFNNVKIFINGKELGSSRFELLVDAQSVNEFGMLKYPAPQNKINEFD